VAHPTAIGFVSTVFVQKFFTIAKSFLITDVVFAMLHTNIAGSAIRRTFVHLRTFYTVLPYNALAINLYNNDSKSDCIFFSPSLHNLIKGSM